MRTALRARLRRSAAYTRAMTLRACLIAAIAFGAPFARADDPVEPPPNQATELPQVSVISTTPLEGLGLPLNQIPSAVQTADSEAMQKQATLDLANYLNANFSGVTASESAANPFQLDIYYHGFKIGRASCRER